MYVARDKDGSLWIYENKPIGKNTTGWLMCPNSKNERIDEDWFPEVLWEDEEPRELVVKPINEERP